METTMRGAEVWLALYSAGAVFAFGCLCRVVGELVSARRRRR